MSYFLSDFFKNENFTFDELNIIVQSFQQVKINKNTFLLKPQQIANHYYIIESGILRSYAKNLKGNDITTCFYTAGELAMDSSSLFLKKASEEFIEALTDVIAYRIEFKRSDELFDTIEPYRKWGRTKLVENLSAYKQRGLALINKSAKERYLDLIKNQSNVIKTAPLKHISSYLGITNSSLSRIRKEILN